MTTKHQEPRRKTKPAPSLKEFLDLSISESDFQAEVCQVLDLYGYEWIHHYDSRRSKEGWPDIYAVKGTRMLAIEAKAESRLKEKNGGVTPDQQKWLDLFHATGKVEDYVCYPSGFKRMVEIIVEGPEA